MFVTLAALFLLPFPQLVDRTESLQQPLPTDAEFPHEKRADIYMARKMYREAVDEYRKALSEEPRNPRLYNKLGISYHHQLNFNEAKRNYERASTLDEKYAQAIYNLGTVYYAERRFKKAQKTYQKALKITPASASVHSNLGTAFFARGKFEKATEAYVQALALDPHVFEHRNATGTLLQERSVEDRAKYYYFMAQAYAEAAMFDRALLYLRRALEEGFGGRGKIADEKAFEPMLEMPEFQALVDPKGAQSARSS